jgi:hypothetical protein
LRHLLRVWMEAFKTARERNNASVVSHAQRVFLRDDAVRALRKEAASHGVHVTSFSQPQTRAAN